jgi:hypothetical protein
LRATQWMILRSGAEGGLRIVRGCQRQASGVIRYA